MEKYDILKAICDVCEPGIYNLPIEFSRSNLRAELTLPQVYLCTLDGSKIVDRRTLFQEIAAGLAFPETFGSNWDALADYINDLCWLSGKRTTIVYTQPEAFAEKHPVDWSIFLEIIEEAVLNWGDTDTPLYVLFQSNRLTSWPILPV
jgi:RNAse (barnase) inhibitor barstar